MTDHKSNRSWAGAVFGLIFLVAGLGAAYVSAGKLIVGYVGSVNWVEVPATIHDVKLVSNHGETTTYTVKSNYSYSFNGVRYDNDRVSLSSGSDNLGRYWQDLERTLRSRQRSNEAFALVDPKNPANALLDRTFRWKSIVFGSIFLILFGGVGGFIAWASLRGTKSDEERLRDEKNDGIESDQKTGSWLIAGFGAVFLVMGGGMSLLVLPDAIRDGEYGALFVLLFVFVGAGIMYYAFKINRAYRRIGPTPLFLDPAVPGVGGQLGGKFTVLVPDGISASDRAPRLLAKLTCSRKSKSGDSTSVSIKWQEEAPVYLKETARGIEASFLFEIPETCSPSKDWSNRSSIDWSVSVEGEFSEPSIGKLERSWGVEVEDSAAQVGSVISIPQSFLNEAQQRSQARAKASALEQILVSEDDEYINVHSKAGRGVGSKLLLMLFGAIFGGVGVFTILDNWWPGYIFLLVGGAIFFMSIFILGKAIEVKIDKGSYVLYTRSSWFGFVYAHGQADVLDPQQFKEKLTSSSSTHNKLTEYYAVYIESNGKKVRVADGIEGKKEALALIEAIVNRCFSEEEQALAA